MDETSTTVDSLRAAWRVYVLDLPSLDEYDEEVRSETLIQETLLAARRDPRVLEALRDIAVQPADGQADDLRDEPTFAVFVRGVLTPYARQALTDEDGFRSHIEVGFDREVMPIRTALALPVADLFLRAGFADRQLDSGWSWFAGTPVGLPGDEWPHDAAGYRLHHVVQVALDEDVLEAASHAGLPTGGVLQIFHDLTAFGEVGDGERGVWRARWLADPDGRLRERAVLLSWPREWSRRDCVEAVPINPELTPSVRSPLDAEGLDDAEFERYERVVDCLEWWIHLDNQARADDGAGISPAPTDPWAPGHVPSELVSKLGGFGHAETNPDLVEILASELPLAPGDSHVLLADINPAQLGAVDWFHGGRHLEVWIRGEDLARADFAAVWCFIRSDA